MVTKAFSALRVHISVPVMIGIVLLAAIHCLSSSASAYSAQQLFEQGKACLHRGDGEEALRLGRQCVIAARQSGDRRQQAIGFSLVGDSLFVLDRVAEAFEAFEHSLSLMREIGDRSGEATALKDLGITCKRLGRYDEAIGLLNQSLVMFRELGDSHQAGSAAENLANAYGGLGAYSLAFEMYQQTLELAEIAGDEKLAFGVLNRIGFLYLDLKDYERALTHFRKALVRAQKADMSAQALAWANQGLASSLLAVGNREEALEVRRDCLAVCRRMGSQNYIAFDLQGLGWIYFDTEPERSLKYFNESLVSLQRGDFTQMSGAYSCIAEAYRRLGDLDHAVEYFKRAIRDIESFRDGLGSEQRRAGFSGRKQAVYQELIKTLIDRNSSQDRDDVNAFAIYEQAKARTLREAIAEAQLDIRGDLAPELSQREKEISFRISDLQKRLSGSTLTTSQRRRTLEQLRENEQELDELAVEIRQRNPRYASVRYPTPLTAEQVQSLLGPSSAMIAYSIARDNIVAFVITNKTFAAIPLETSPEQLADRLQAYVDLIAQTDRLDSQNAAARLYRELMGSIEGRLPAGIGRLIIVPDGMLHFLPFETLIREGRYLIEEYEISYAPSATVLAQLTTSRRRSEAGGPASLLLVASPALEWIRSKESNEEDRSLNEEDRSLYEEEGLRVDPIPFSAAEGATLSQYAGPESAVYIGVEATEQRLKASDLGRFRLIHFSTHGLISQWKPDRSALVLGTSEGDREDGFLQAREIYRMKLESDLVVLSACQTARGQLLGGEGAQGLARAFFYAGAKSVVASLWNVNDESTAELMKHFYANLAASESTAAALRSAKLALLRENPTLAPRHWGAFILIGEGNGSIPLKRRWWPIRYNRWLILTGAGVAMLVAMILFRRRVQKAKFR